MDFTVNAEALVGLASRPYYRLPTDPYPAFNAVEIDPVSEVSHNGEVFRSRWSRPVDAVSAVLMRSSAMGEFILDAPTSSLTEFVMTFPTRQFYVDATGGLAPFAPAVSIPTWCRTLALADTQAEYFTREASGGPIPPGVAITGLPSPDGILCGSAVVASVRNGAPHIPTQSNISQILGSGNLGYWGSGLTVPRAASNGWIRVTTPATSVLDSLPTSVRWPPAGAEPLPGAHRYRGLPVVGFTLRTFRNDAVACQSGTCQGNYGGAFPLKYQRSVTPVP